MSASFSLKNLFAKNPSEEMDPSVTQELSLAAPDPSTASIESGGSIAGDSLDDDSISEEIDRAELITVPVLGRRTTATHQRILFTLLSLALVVLGGVAIYSVN